MVTISLQANEFSLDPVRNMRANAVRARLPCYSSRGTRAFMHFTHTQWTLLVEVKFCCMSLPVQAPRTL